VAVTCALPMPVPHTRSRYSGSPVTCSTHPHLCFPARASRVRWHRPGNLTRVPEAAMNRPREDRLPASG
jgi:hypothetical protein